MAAEKKQTQLGREQLNQRYLLVTRRFATLAASVVAVCVLLVVLIVVPQIQSTVQVFSDLQDANEDVSNLERKVAQLQNLPQSILLQASDDINAVLPSKKPLLELLSAYNQLAIQTGVQFSDVSLAPGVISTQSAQVTTAGGRRAAPTRRRSTEYDQLDLSLKVTGNLNDINIFLQQVEEIAPVTTVTSMSLSERRLRLAEQVETVFEADLVTSSYFYTESVTAAVRAAVPTLSADQQEVITEIQSYYVPQVNEQTTIQGGGLEDLFGLSEVDLLSL
jgi:Tfp pilus assembly protein PilO